MGMMYNTNLDACTNQLAQNSLIYLLTTPQSILPIGRKKLTLCTLYQV